MKRKILGSCFIITGICILCFTLFTRYESYKRQTQMLESFQKVLEESEKSSKFTSEILDTEENSIDDTSLQISDEKKNMCEETLDSDIKISNSSNFNSDNKCNAAITTPPNNTIGIIEIPKIDLKVTLSEGVTMENLKYAVTHFEESATPGEKGNCCIAGHRSYTYNKFFNRLDELEKGDEIKIKTTKGDFSYIVYNTIVVEPEDTWVLDDAENTEVTLVTCTPIRIATHRLIIKGKLKKQTKY